MVVSGDELLSVVFVVRNPADLVQTLKFVIKNGNKTVYEWRTGATPKQIERPTEAEVKFGDEEEANQATRSDEINFDIDVVEPTAADGQQDKVSRPQRERERRTCTPCTCKSPSNASLSVQRAAMPSTGATLIWSIRAT